MLFVGEIIGKSQFETARRKIEREQQIKEQEMSIPERYAGDIRLFIAFCEGTGQPESIGAMLDYLYVSLKEQRVKKTTWERRLSAAKKHLSVTHGLTLDEAAKRELAGMRSIYKREEYAELNHIQGQNATDKDELLAMIDKLDARAKAVCLVNLITANRPSEMVRMKIKDFDLTDRSVLVFMKKQKESKRKRLTLEAVRAVKAYIKAYGLKSDDYFVGRVRRGGSYESVQIGEVGYNKAIQRWLGFAPYTLRKTQVTAMHENGADLPAIAKQTGHKSLEVLSKHYLTVNDRTVDKYL